MLVSCELYWPRLRLHTGSLDIEKHCKAIFRLRYEVKLTGKALYIIVESLARMQTLDNILLSPAHERVEPWFVLGFNLGYPMLVKPSGAVLMNFRSTDSCVS